MQSDKSGNKHVIALASRVLTAPEYNYSVTCSTFKHLHNMVMEYNVVVYTNHAAIPNPFKGRNLHGRLARWFSWLRAYNPELKVITEITNMVADALSRNIPIGVITNTELSATSHHQGSTPLSKTTLCGERLFMP